MTTAKSICDSIARHQANTFTLLCGYAISGVSPGGRVLFEPGRLLKERRNDKGRCAYALFSYHDGSRLEFKWSEVRGFTLTPIDPIKGGKPCAA